MKILYLNQSSLLSQHFYRGWKNAFNALGYHVDSIDYSRQSVTDYLSRVGSELSYDMIMTASNEGILDIPVDRINDMGAALVINGLPFNSLRISPDPQAPCANEREVRHLSRFHKKIVWSQWMPEFVGHFFAGYRQLGIPTLSMPYAADITPLGLVGVVATRPETDLIFVGNLKHRAKQNLPIFRQLFAHCRSDRIQIFGDQSWNKIFNKTLSAVRFTNPSDDMATLYQNSAFSPNLHTARQKRDAVQVNDRLFQIAAYKGFQICDTPLVEEFYGSDEVPWTRDADEYVALARGFIEKPERRLAFVEKAYKKTALKHSWFNRIAQIQQALGLKGSVSIGDQTWLPFTYRPDIAERQKIRSERLFYYFCETHGLDFARSLKRILIR